MVAFYLHGFASSARSSKAAFFGSRLAARGVDVHVPDFNEPDFSTLTVTRMVEQVEAALPGLRDVVLIGSSLGAFVAVQVALRRAGDVSRLVLLAPALDCGRDRLRDLGDVDAWERSNRLDVFHHAFGRVMPLHYELVRDAGRYDCLQAELAVPVQVFQGRRDTAVDPDAVARWAGTRPNVELHMLDDDHQLHASLEHIWREMTRFLGLALSG